MCRVRGCDGPVKITRITLLRGIKIVENLNENVLAEEFHRNIVTKL
jgi:hypothetical protein